MADLNGIDMKEFSENGLAEIAGLISRREYNFGIVKARQLAEKLIRSYASERRIDYTSFADTIEELYQNGAIDRTSRDAYHSIRVYGNKAVHEGDDSAEDAQNALYLLKNEFQTYLSRKNVSIDRTPVRVERSQINRRPAAGEERRRSSSEGGQRRASGERRSSSARGTGSTKRSGSASSAQRSGKSSGRPQEEEKGGFNIYDILRILIPIVVVILVIIIVKSILPSKTAVPETSAIETTAEVVETTVAETVPETTTEAETGLDVIRYKIKGDGVNIRYADNQNRIYTQLDNGVEIGEVTPLEDSDFVQFILDGVNVVVRKDFITPVE